MAYHREHSLFNIIFIMRTKGKIFLCAVIIAPGFFFVMSITFFTIPYRMDNNEEKNPIRFLPAAYRLGTQA
jgi:hypothetical protein